MQFRRCNQRRFRIAGLVAEEGRFLARRPKCMGTRRSRRMSACVIPMVLSLVVAPGGTFAPWIPVVLSAAETVASDAPWPRRFQAADGSIVTMFEPQIATWDNQKKMEVYAAVTHL